MTTHKLIVTPHIRPNGTKHPNAAFAARLEGSDEVLCVSEIPLLDSARVLMKAGVVDPNDMLEMYHAGSRFFLVRGKIGKLATLTIVETGFGPKLRPYKPHPGAEAWKTRDPSS